MNADGTGATRLTTGPGWDVVPSWAPTNISTITLSPPTLSGGSIGTPYSQTITASGGMAPYIYSVTVGTLPAGLTLTGGTISGTPSAAGTSAFTIKATDSQSSNGSRAYSITINGGSTSTKIGVYDNGVWYLDNDGSGTWNIGDMAASFGSYGWTAVVGDWNGDGNIEIGVSNGQTWYLDVDGSGTWNAGDKALSFGAVGWKPIVGDWNPAVPGTEIGVYKDGTWYLDMDGSGTWSAGDRACNFGAPGWTPILGKWQ